MTSQDEEFLIDEGILIDNASCQTTARSPITPTEKRPNDRGYRLKDLLTSLNLGLWDVVMAIAALVIACIVTIFFLQLLYSAA